MKQKSLSYKLTEYIILITAGVSAAFNICLFAVWTSNLYKNFLGMVFTSAIFLLLPCFFKRAAKITAVICGIVVIILSGYAILKCNGLNLFLTAMSTTNLILKLPNNFISAFVCAVAGLFSILMFISSQNRLSLFLIAIIETFIVFIMPSYNYSYSMPALLIFIGCCAVLYLRLTAVSIAKKNGFKIKHIIIFTVIASAFCVASIMLSQLSFSYFNSAFSNIPKVNYVDAFNNITGVFSLKSTTGFGDYNPLRRLGGKVENDDTIVLEVNADEPFYLRGRIFDTFTGSGWQAVTNDTTGFYNSSVYTDIPIYNHNFLFRDGRINYFVWIKFRSALKTDNIKVTVKTEDQKYLFLPSGVIMGSIEFSDKNVVMLRHYPDFLMNRKLSVNSDYDVEYHVINVNSTNFEELLETSEQDFKNLQNNPDLKDSMDTYVEYNKEVKKVYTNTNNVTQRTRNLAALITSGCSTDIDKVNAIRNWLKNNCTYTLSPNESIFNGNFVDHFLFESKAGYCQHYASAMTILLRCAGVPARYVEGYAAPSIKSNGVYEVTNRQSHAWVEFYSDMYGFITVDPTPSAKLPRVLNENEIASKKSSSSISSSNPASSKSSSKVSESSSSASTSNSNRTAPVLKRSVNNTATVIAAVISFIILLLILYFGKALIRSVKLKFISRLPRNEQAYWYYNYFISALAHLGLSLESFSTPNEFADFIRDKIKFGEIDFDRLTDIYISARFDRREISEEDIGIMREFYKSFHKYCRCYAGNAAYILKYPLL